MLRIGLGYNITHNLIKNVLTVNIGNLQEVMDF